MTAGKTVAPLEIAWRDGLPADEYWAIDPSIKTKTPATVCAAGRIVV